MRSTLDAFLNEIGELKIFVESMDEIDKKLSAHKTPYFGACRNIRRRLDYAAFIVASYTALERFVEEIVWSHTELESSQNKYSDLCEKLRSKHLRQSGELICKGRLGEGRYTGVTEAEIVRNLHQCLSDHENYKLNRHAVVHHDRNLRSDVLAEVFGRLGIENFMDAVCGIQGMKEWYTIDQRDDRYPEHSVLKRIVEFKLGDLVERRNQVSHAGRDLDEYLDSEEMMDRLRFLEACGRSMFDILAPAYIDRYYVQSGKAVSIGRPIEGPFKEKKVVVVAKPPCKIFKGQPIVGVLDKQVNRYGYIEEVRANDSAVDSIDPESGFSDAGLKTDFNMSGRIELFVLPEIDHAVWS